MTSSTVDRTRVRALNEASLRRVVEPEHELDFALGAAPVLPRELLTVDGVSLGRELADDDCVHLAREELASMLQSGIAFEAVLDAVFSYRLAEADDLTDPQYSYMLHEVGEETRHQRAFLRLLRELRPTARNPFDRPIGRAFQRVQLRILLHSPAYFGVLLLAGEEIPDLLQSLTIDHDGVDPAVRAVNRYHRQEEARHLAFARVMLPEWWATASRVERFRVRHLAPAMIRFLFMTMVHPGVYATVGLPPWRTWRAVNRHETRRALLAEATRPIVRTLLDATVLRAGRVPRGWRALAQVDHFGRPR